MNVFSEKKVERKPVIVAFGERTNRLEGPSGVRKEQLKTSTKRELKFILPDVQRAAMLPSLADEVKTKPKETATSLEVSLPKISVDPPNKTYFLNLFLENESTPSANNVEKMQRLVLMVILVVVRYIFSQITGKQQQRRKDYLRTRGLEAAIRRQIQLYEKRATANNDSSKLCDGLTSRYDRSLAKAFSSLVADFASKSFELSCMIAAAEYETRDNDEDLSEIRDLEEKKDERKWRINREKERIARADEMLKRDETL